MEIDLNTWIISDTHFFHDNIVKYCNRPLRHTEIMFEEWRGNVADNDKILHLGDLFMGIKRDDPKVYSLLHHLPGQKFLLMGNHDKQKPRFYRDFGFEIVRPFTKMFPDGLMVRFSHYPESHGELNWNLNIHGHIHNNGYGREHIVPGRKYVNVSVEEMDYKPVRLKDVLRKAGV